VKLLFLEFNIIDSLVQGLRCAYQIGLLLAHGSNLGRMPFLLPPMTHGYQHELNQRIIE